MPIRKTCVSFYCLGNEILKIMLQLIVYIRKQLLIQITDIMLKKESKQSLLVEINTKYKELKHVLNSILSGSISEKMMILFTCKRPILTYEG